MPSPYALTHHTHTHTPLHPKRSESEKERRDGTRGEYLQNTDLAILISFQLVVQKWNFFWRSSVKNQNIIPVYLIGRFLR